MPEAGSSPEEKLRANTRSITFEKVRSKSSRARAISRLTRPTTPECAISLDTYIRAE